MCNCKFIKPGKIFTNWFVLIVAALGWLFDCLDQQLFNAARVPAMRDLLQTTDMGKVTESVNRSR